MTKEVMLKHLRRYSYSFDRRNRFGMFVCSEVRGVKRYSFSVSTRFVNIWVGSWHFQWGK